MTVYSGLDSGTSIVYSTSRFMDPEEASRYSFFVSTLPGKVDYFLDVEVEKLAYRIIPRSFGTCLRIVKYRNKKNRKQRNKRR